MTHSGAPLPLSFRATAAARRVLGRAGTRAVSRTPLAVPLRRALSSAAPTGLPLVQICAGEVAGIRMHLDLATERSCWLGTHEEASQRAMRESVTRDAIVYDVGARAGFFTLLASRLAGSDGRVIAFEPLPALAARLRVNLAANACSNVDVLEAAVTDSRDASDLRTASGTISARAVTIDDVVRAGAPVPELIKIDAGGSESAVLRGAADVVRNFRPLLLVKVQSEGAGRELLEAMPVPYEFRDLDNNVVSAAPRPGDYLARAVGKVAS